jgi:thiamine-phosphate pyrophosphorylase
VKPLPRVLAYTDGAITSLGDLGVRAAAIAAAGPAVALVARSSGASADSVATLALRFRALATPPMAGLLVSARTDIALIAHADGVILRTGGLPIGAARRIAPAIQIFSSVHTEAEAEAAAADGADGLIAGTIWASASHPERAGAGTGFLSRIARLGVPTYAIGGVTAARVSEAMAAGAYGVAVLSALWHAHRPYHATRELIAACS